MTRLEQSKVVGPLAPRTYGLPTCASARLAYCDSVIVPLQGVSKKLFAFLATSDPPQSDAEIACAIDTDAGTPNLRWAACAAPTTLAMNSVLPVPEAA